MQKVAAPMGSKSMALFPWNVVLHVDIQEGKLMSRLSQQAGAIRYDLLDGESNIETRCGGPELIPKQTSIRRQLPIDTRMSSSLSFVSTFCIIILYPNLGSKLSGGNVETRALFKLYLYHQRTVLSQLICLRPDLFGQRTKGEQISTSKPASPRPILFFFFLFPFFHPKT